MRVIAFILAILLSCPAMAQVKLSQLPLSTYNSGTDTVLAVRQNASTDYLVPIPIVTWPSSGGVLISTGGNSPSSISPVNGNCLIGSAGSWVSGACSSGGGDTITSPNSTLAVGGTSTNTTLDLNLGTSNTWSANQIFGNHISFGGALLNVAALASNNLLQYNGSNWVNVAPSSLGLGTVTSIATTSPITGGTITTTGTIACATCATTTNGGALSGTAPIAVSAAGVISGGGLGTVTGALKGNGSGTITQAACADLSNGTASCSTDTTNASNISSGTLAAARGGAGTISGALKGSGAGVVTQAACADLSNGATGCSTATGTSGATIPLNNGSNTFSGSNIQSGAYAITTTSTPTQAAGTLGIAGTATKPTLGANSEGDFFLTATGGLNAIGQGSSFDWSLFNKSGTSVCTVATGTTNWNCTGLQVGGTAVLTANQSITLTGDTTGSGATSIATTTSKLNGTSLAGLATGLLKNTTATGVPSIAASSDIIGLFTGCSGSQYLGADGACHNASGAGTVTSIIAGTGLTGGTITTSGTIALDLTQGNTWTGLTTLSPGSGISEYVTAGAVEEAVFSNGNSGTSMALNCDNGNVQSVTITGAVTFTFTAPTHSCKFTVLVTQDGSGHVYSYPAAVIWPSGTAPTWSSAASAKDAATFVYDGTSYWGEGSTAFATSR